MVGNVTGMVCDGAKADCALKISTCVNAACQAAAMGVRGVRVQSTDGIVEHNVEYTLDNFATLSTHGTSDSVLQIAAGHLEGTSLPVGGESTHAVISAHRGLPSAKLFTNLDQLEVGDTFTITVLDRVLTYEVDQISIVLPTETDNLKVVDGKDYVTLMTCTPYGINSHRLLVRGRRIETPDKLKHIRVTADAIKIEPIITAPIMALPLLLVLLLWLLFSTRKRKSTRGENHETH